MRQLARKVCKIANCLYLCLQLEYASLWKLSSLIYMCLQIYLHYNIFLFDYHLDYIISEKFWKIFQRRWQCLRWFRKYIFESYITLWKFPEVCWSGFCSTTGAYCSTSEGVLSFDPLSVTSDWISLSLLSPESFWLNIFVYTIRNFKISITITIWQLRNSSWCMKIDDLIFLFIKIHNCFFH